MNNIASLAYIHGTPPYLSQREDHGVVEGSALQFIDTLTERNFYPEAK